MCGLCNENVQKRLLAGSYLALEVANKIIQVMEMVAKDAMKF